MILNMKKFFLFLFLLLYLTTANAEQLADRCSFFEKKFNDELIIEEDKYNWFPHIMNRTNISDIQFKRMYFKKTNGHYGLKLIYKNNEFDFCYPFYITPTGILVEVKDVENQLMFYKTQRELVFSILTSYNCGNPCTNSLVYTISIPLKYRNGFMDFRGLTIRENQTMSNWFVDYLTFNEAYALHKDLELDLYWRGKWYRID